MQDFSTAQPLKTIILPARYECTVVGMELGKTKNNGHDMIIVTIGLDSDAQYAGTVIRDYFAFTPQDESGFARRRFRSVLDAIHYMPKRPDEYVRGYETMIAEIMGQPRRCSVLTKLEYSISKDNGTTWTRVDEGVYKTYDELKNNQARIERYMPGLTAAPRYDIDWSANAKQDDDLPF